MLHHVGSGGRPSPLLLSAAQDGSVCAWSTSTGQCVQRLHAHDHWVMALALGRRADASRDGLLLSGGYDGTVRAWVCPADDLAAGGGGWALCHPRGPHRRRHVAGALAVVPPGFSGSNDGTVRPAPPTARAPRRRRVGDGVAPRERLPRHGLEDGRVMLWDTSSSTCPPASSPASSTPRPAPPRRLAASGEELVKDVVAARRRRRRASCIRSTSSTPTARAPRSAASARAPTGRRSSAVWTTAASRCSAMWMGRRRSIDEWTLCTCVVRMRDVGSIASRERGRSRAPRRREAIS